MISGQDFWRMPMAPKIKKKRRKKTKNLYFTKVHQRAIVDYVRSEDKLERERLYTRLIGPAFSELVDKICFTYKFTSLPNSDVLRDECKIHLSTILQKFDEKKGPKAFSYFSVVTKNWFIQKAKKNAKRMTREVNIRDAQSEIDETYEHLSTNYLDEKEDQQFWASLLTSVDNWEKEIRKDVDNKVPKSEIDLKVVRAIKDMLVYPERLDILNKKAAYIYMREITGLNTKQITSSLTKLKSNYRQFKVNWQSGDV